MVSGQPLYRGQPASWPVGEYWTPDWDCAVYYATNIYCDDPDPVVYGGFLDRSPPDGIEVSEDTVILGSDVYKIDPADIEIVERFSANTVYCLDYDTEAVDHTHPTWREQLGCYDDYDACGFADYYECYTKRGGPS